MLKKFAMLSAILLASCAWNPVMAPYGYKGATAEDAAHSATIWGSADQTQMYFRKIDGKGLPSRGGGGYPISLSLPGGTYTVEVYFYNFDGRDTVIDLPMSVEAGHVYVVEHQYSADNKRVGLHLKDLGVGTSCHYERYKQVRGDARLVCAPSGE